MKDFEYYEKKPESSIRSLSDLERYEIFNLESAEKYDSASNIDFIIDEEGNIKFLVVGISTGKFSFFGSKEYVEIPWECVTKVGTNVIVICRGRKDKESESLKNLRGKFPWIL